MFRLIAPGDVLPALLALCFFVGCFATMAWYVLTDRRKQHHRHMAHLPLDDDQGASHG